LPLLAALDQVAKTRVDFGGVVQILAIEVRGREKGQVLPIAEERGIGAEVGGYLLGLALLNRGARRQQVVVVLQRKLNGFVERDPDLAFAELESAEAESAEAGTGLPPSRREQKQRAGSKLVRISTFLSAACNSTGNVRC
jgi:hypothetical protein